MGTHLSIDETSLSQGELYTIVTNKAAKGKKGSLVAIIRGVKSENVIFVLSQLPENKRKMVQKWTKSQTQGAEILFEDYPEIKMAYDVSLELTHIYNLKIKKKIALTKFAHWYNKVDRLNCKFFKSVVQTMQNNYRDIVNYFDNRSINASAESFNAKLKPLDLNS